MIARRRLAAGLAWTVPAVTLASVAPAYAASGCPDVSVAEIYVSTTQDRITVNNLAGSVTMPAGTTITWKMTNLSGSSDTITLGLGTGLQMPTNSPLTLGATSPTNTGTFVFKTSNNLTAGSSVNWLYQSSDWNLRGTVTISFAGTTLSKCPDIVRCVSVLGSAVGTTCPAGAAPANRVAGDPTIGVSYPRV